MRPFDEDKRPFEQKIVDAAKEQSVTLSAAETDMMRQRIRFALFDAEPADLSVAQLAEWLRRILPSIRQAQATVNQHVALAGLEEPAKEHAGLFPDSLLKRFSEAADPYQLDRNGPQEILCSVSENRRVRFNPANMVVTPLKITNE